MTDFDYTRLPAYYALCPLSACPRAAECLRQCLYEGLTPDVTDFRCLNLRALPSADGTDCPHFHPAVKVRFAWGLMGVLSQLEQLPYGQARDAKAAVCGVFGRRTFYRARRGDRPISPDEQACIRRIFQHFGLTEDPQFDRYEYRYDL